MAVLVRSEPWRITRELEREVDRLVGRGLGPRLGVPWQWVVPQSEEDRWVPACDLFARAGDLVVRMEQALHGLLAKVRDLGLPLLSVRRLDRE